VQRSRQATLLDSAEGAGSMLTWLAACQVKLTTAHTQQWRALLGSAVKRAAVLRGLRPLHPLRR